MNDLLPDLRYALRVLWKSPAFALVATLTLMLGIGANVVVFGVLNALLLQPLEVSDPSNLHQVRLQPWSSFKALTTSVPAFEDYRQRSSSFSGLAGYNGYSGGRLRWNHSEREVFGHAVTGNYFELLGVQPQLGRLIQPADERGANSAPFLVLSDRLWRSAFGADPGIVGTTVRLGKDAFTVVGVGPARFHGTERFLWPDYWIPLVNHLSAASLQDRAGRALTVLGRLKPGVTPAQAAEDLSAIAAQLAREHPQTDPGTPLRLIRPGLYGDSGDVIRSFLWSASGLALLVLLAACANLASLFSARANDRSRELAVRVALGAGRWRLLRQLLTEAMLVSLLGGAAGLLLARLLLGLLSGWSSPFGQVAISVDFHVYGAAVCLTLGSGLIFGLLPARQLWECHPLRALKGGVADSTPRRRLGLSDLLLGVQIALCTLLVAAAFIAGRGMLRLRQAPLGFQPQGALVASLDVSEGDDLTIGQKAALIEAVRGLPGITAAAAVSRLPLTGGLRGTPVFRPGTTDLSLTNAVLEPYGFTISPGYLEAAGTRLLRGRQVTSQDTADAPAVALVNATCARQLWGDPASALGQRFLVSGRLREVVGVVEDGKYHEIAEPARPAFFLPLTQSEPTSLTFVVRSPRLPSEVAAALERTLRGFAPEASLTVRSWPEAIGNALFPAAAATATLGVLGLLAAMLATTGIFGLAAWHVSRRLPELGLRVALGARARHILQAAVGRPLALLTAGSAAGVLLSLWTDRVLAPFVYQANAHDPWVLLGVVLAMTLLGLAASAIPALRALAVDPSRLIRES